MLRCVLLVIALAATTLPASAQTVRKFTAQTLRGELTVTQPPEVLLNSKPARLSPGARIRGADNMLQMSGELVGQRLLVHFTLDPSGQLTDVWVLTASEASRKPWPVTPQQAASWSFNPDTQSWSR